MQTITGLVSRLLCPILLNTQAIQTVHTCNTRNPAGRPRADHPRPGVPPGGWAAGHRLLAAPAGEAVEGAGASRRLDQAHVLLARGSRTLAVSGLKMLADHGVRSIVPRASAPWQVMTSLPFNDAAEELNPSSQ